MPVTPDQSAGRASSSTLVPLSGAASAAILLGEPVQPVEAGVLVVVRGVLLGRGQGPPGRDRRAD